MSKLTKKHNFAEKNSTLAKQWHFNKNRPLTPYDVTPSSHQKVWWFCKRGHIWQTMVKSRSKGSGCPYCAGQKVSKDNCLKTLNPILAKQWYYPRNGSLTPSDVTYGAGKMVWWKCTKNKMHIWKTRVIERKRGYGCPICVGKIVTKENCFKTAQPVLAKEWHPTKNGKLTSSDVTMMSNKVIWWRCRKNKKHVWKIKVASRIFHSRCPMC